MQKTITAKTATTEYPIYIGENLLNQRTLLNHHIVNQQVLIVSNETVAPLYLTTLQQSFIDSVCDTIILKDGETYKTLTQVNAIWDRLIKKQHHRDTTLIALGGGVIGDMTGFAAACFQRGVGFIQIPTTLLAQVDASVGGKTAVNHPGGKNLIGAFHQPRAVIIDIDTLNTLPEREFKAGLAEIIKAALIKDVEFFTWLEKNITALISKESSALQHAIARAVEIKRDIVAADEKEHGVRALLNLGHTFAHAIEHNLGYGQWLHGEAVAAGLVLAAKLSVATQSLSQHTCDRIQALIQQCDLPTDLPTKLTPDQLIASMQNDKKVLNQQIRLVLLNDIGSAIITSTINHDALHAFLAGTVNQQNAL